MTTISKALNALGITEWVLTKEPTTEAEFYSSFKKVTGEDDTGTAMLSSNPDDFGVSWNEIQAEVQRLQAEYDAQEYARNRAKEYPAMEDYLDGVVKGDQAQIDKYIADCLAVKEKYPK